MIFCGSHDYPERGYLDRLATLCQSQGTNAYTADDHTCYTFVTSSLPGLQRLLPVFLDHIFRPTLEAAIIKREVFHKDCTGGGRGVVYCEMGGREWSEQDQLDLALRRGVMGHFAPELSVYGWECGGRTKCLARLGMDEIREYHRLFYRADNATVVVVGGRSLQEALPSLHSIVATAKFLPPPTSTIVEPPTERGFDVVPTCQLKFPSNDESLGSVGFSWPGPPSDALYEITAIHILMRMLKDTAASPLYQHFVERARPIASDIDHEVKGTYQTIITLLFSGVPIRRSREEASDEGEEMEGEEEGGEEEEEEEGDELEAETAAANNPNDPPINGGEPSHGVHPGADSVSYLDKGVLYREVINCIRAWAADETAVRERLRVALKSMTIKMQESLEDDPHDVFAAYCSTEIVRAHWAFDKPKPGEQPASPHYGSSVLRMPKVLEELGAEPLEFWLGLLERHLLQAIPSEARTLPSQAMNQTVKEWEHQQLEGIPCDTLPKETITELTPLPKFDLTVPESILCTISCQPGHEQVALPTTGVKRLTMLIEIANEKITAEDWPCLVLLQELFFNCDVQIPAKLLDNGIITQPQPIPYQDLVARLSTEFSTFEASVGFNNELFSVGYLDSHMVFSLHGRVGYSLEQMQRLLRAIIAGTDIQIGRVTEVLENLTSQLKDSWSDPSTVLDTMLTTILHGAHHAQATKRPRNNHSPEMTPHVDYAMGLVSQTDYFCKARKMATEDPEALVESLKRVQRALVELPYSLHEGVGSDSIRLPDEEAADFWNPNDRVYTVPKNGALEDCAVNEEAAIQVIPMADITSSYLTLSVPLNLLPRQKNPVEYSGEQVDRMLAMSTICQLLSYTEGPLYRRVRGAGLAYGASVNLALWSGLLTFNLDDSTDPAKALQVFLQLLEELAREIAEIETRQGEILHSEAIKTAQAAQLFQFVSERSTPSAAVSSALRCALRGLPRVGSALERQWNARLLQLTVKDIAVCLDQMISLMRDPSKSIRLLTVPANSLATIKEELVKDGHRVIVNNVTDYSHRLQSHHH